MDDASNWSKTSLGALVVVLVPDLLRVLAHAHDPAVAPDLDPGARAAAVPRGIIRSRLIFL